MGLQDIFASYTFERRAVGRMRMIVRCEGGDRIAEALASGEHCVPVARAERGALRKFEWAPGGHGLVRACHRGGFVSHFTDDRYLVVNRPGNEFETHWRVEQTGLPVPRVLGAMWERRGLWVSGALATELLPGPDLLAWLHGHASDGVRAEREEMLRRVGALVRNMHLRGVWHADLQVRNVVIVEGLPHLIDLDRARIGAVPGWVSCSRNLLRFRRSLERNGLDESLFQSFLDGYGVPEKAAIPAWLDLAYRLRGRFSEYVRRLRAEG